MRVLGRPGFRFYGETQPRLKRATALTAYEASPKSKYLVKRFDSIVLLYLGLGVEFGNHALIPWPYGLFLA